MKKHTQPHQTGAHTSTGTQCVVGAGSHTVWPPTSVREHTARPRDAGTADQSRFAPLQSAARYDRWYSMHPHNTYAYGGSQKQILCGSDHTMTAGRHRQTTTHYTRQLYMCELKRQEAMVMTQQQNTQNDRHGMLSTILTGCSK